MSSKPDYRTIWGPHYYASFARADADIIARDSVKSGLF